jgi:hypothetical protein
VDLAAERRAVGVADDRLALHVQRVGRRHADPSCSGRAPEYDDWVRPGDVRPSITSLRSGMSTRGAGEPEQRARCAAERAATTIRAFVSAEAERPQHLARTRAGTVPRDHARRPTGHTIAHSRVRTR